MLKFPKFAKFVPASIGVMAMSFSAVPYKIRHMLTRLSKTDLLLLQADQSAEKVLRGAAGERRRREVGGQQVSDGSGGEEPILYEASGPVAWITLNRPRYRNAQNAALLYALDEAFARFADDDDLRVAVLGAAGDHFSAGHDLGSPGVDHEETQDRRTLWWDHVGKEGADRTLAREEEIYLGHVPPLGGVAEADDRDGPRGLRRGGPEAGLGVRPDRRRRRRLLRRAASADGRAGDRGVQAPLGARRRARRRSSSSPASRSAPSERTLSGWSTASCLAPSCAIRPRRSRSASRANSRFSLALAKKAVNAAEEAQGQRMAMDQAFSLHQIAHLQNELTTGSRTASQGVGEVKEAMGRDG